MTAGGGARRLALSVLALVAGLTAPARADEARTARLEPPTCDGLPFAHERLAALLAVELAVHRVTLVDGPADEVIRYDPVRCGEAGSPIRVVVERRGVIAARVRIAHEPPRALALYLAELMREPFDDPVADLLAGRVTATELHPDPPSAAAALGDPRRRRGSRWTVVIPRREDDARRSNDLRHASVVGGSFLLESLYNPANQSWLVGPRVGVTLRTPFYPHLRLHVDAAVVTGASDWGIHLGAASVGFEVALAAGDRDLYMEVGPRWSVMHAWAVSLPNEQLWTVQDGMLTLGASIRLVARVDEGTSFVTAFEASAPMTDGVAFGSTDRRDPVGGGIDDAFFALRLGLLLD